MSNVPSAATRTPPFTAGSVRRKKRQWTGLLYLVPIFFFLLTFIYFGIGFNVVLSLFRWDGINPMQFIGLRNYVVLANDPVFHQALGNTLVFSLINIPGRLILGFVFAVLLHSASFGTGLFKSLFFLPHVMAIVVIGITFQVIYEPSFGMLNVALRSIGLGNLTRQWLGDPRLVLTSIAAVLIYAQVGLYTLIYYTSILTVDQDILEAATIDGAGLYSQVFRIIVPMLRGAHITLLILGVVSSLKVFELVWIMTRGGPGGASDLISTYLFQKALLEFQQGYSAAISVILLMIAFVFSAISLRRYAAGRG